MANNLDRETQTFDVMTIGGGLVGASLACALGSRSMRVGVVEAALFSAEAQPGYDERVIALAEGSRRIFSGIGVWETIAPEATPIRKIHVSERGGYGFARLDARDHQVDALGYVVPARCIGAALASRIETLPTVRLISPARLEEAAVQHECVAGRIVCADREVNIEGRLLVAADGANSRVRELLRIPAVRWTYGQTAVIANVTPERPHDNVAYERFTANGPLAVLPLKDDRCAVVCTLPDDKVGDIEGLSDEAFARFLEQSFGTRLGRFVRIGRRHSYPLSMIRSREHACHRVAIIGNAAHSLHPVAGQGFNLGLRDVAALAEVIVDSASAGRDFGTLPCLQEFAQWRRWDQAQTAGFTDGLVRLFSNPLPPVRFARDLGLLAFDLVPPAKRWVALHAMGLSGRLPRLARGVPL